MYWNAVRTENLDKEKKLRETLNKETLPTKPRGRSFDDFLEEDKTAESGTYVYNTGAQANPEPQLGLRNRGVRGLDLGSIYANPFSDEQAFEAETQRAIEESLMSPDASERLEVMSDLYSASDAPRPPQNNNTYTPIAEQLIDISEPVPDPPVSYPSIEDLNPSTSFANMAERDDSAYASIHAWSDNTTRSFYAPPVAAAAADAAPGSPLFSDPPESVPGDLTPTDSMSLAGSSAEEVWAPRSGATSEGGDVMSVDGEGVSTPGSWTEVGSVVSENDVRN